MAKIYLIHGFNVSDEGKTSTGTLRPLLEMSGHDVSEIHYGWFGRLRVRLCNKSVARTVADLVEPGSYVIAHSNGATIALLAAKYGAPFKGVILINPALNSQLEVPHVEKVHVFYAPSDPWTKIARYIPASIWGSQGATGYTGPDEAGRYTQTNLDKLTGAEVGHSGIFETFTRIQKITRVINHQIDQE